MPALRNFCGTERPWRGDGTEHRRAWAARAARRLADPNVSYVYFMQAGAGGPIKIGYSGDPAARLRSVRHERGGAPVHLTRIVRVHVGRVGELEARLHQHFRRAHLHGEWFRPIPELARLAHGEVGIAAG